MLKKPVKRLLKILGWILLGIILFILMILLVIGAFHYITSPSKADKDLAHADVYIHNRMEYPSIVSVIGEKRKVYAVYDTTDSLTLAYWSRANQIDVKRYADYLVQNAGFTVIEQDERWPEPYSKTKLGKPRPETGNMRYLEIKNEDDKYYIKIW